jgi:hypothetical protein
MEHYGGVDDPERRNGYYPADFIPKENPFYCALPYSDFDPNGRKPDYKDVIPWAKYKTYAPNESACKNRWIEIRYKGKSCFAQWEDAGPFYHDDVEYVFGTKPPKYHRSGIDISPAVRDYLGFRGKAKVDWRFVEESQVPDGPWKEIITRSNCFWK